MNLEELSNKFKNGEINFADTEEYLIEGNSFSTFRDFNTLINLSRAQRDGYDEITYIGESGHLNFRFIYENGSLIPESVYIKSDAELKEEAQETLRKMGFPIRESKIIKFKDFK